MAKTAKIIFGGAEYTVRPFNIGQIERLAEIVTNDKLPGIRRSLTVIEMALERAEPKFAGDFNEVESSLDEISAAATALIELAGLKAPENPPAPAETAGA